MAVVPAVPIFTDAVSSSVTFNQLGAVVSFLQSPPIANLRQASAQTLTSSVWADITFDTEDVDKDYAGTFGHDNVTNNARWTATYPGYYVFTGGVGFSNLGAPAGRRGTRWAISGSVQNGSAQLFNVTGASGAIAARGMAAYLFAGDYVTLQGFFEGGGTLGLSVTAEQQSSMTIFHKSI